MFPMYMDFSRMYDRIVVVGERHYNMNVKVGL